MEGYQGRYLGIHGEEKGLIKKPSKSEEIAKDKGGNIEFQKTGKKKKTVCIWGESQDWVKKHSCFTAQTPLPSEGSHT